MEYCGGSNAPRIAEPGGQRLRSSGSSWPFPRVIAHRGGGAFAPENTLAAIRKGKSMGFSAVEFDVMLAADGVPVLIHDETLERTTSGHGPVSRRSSVELRTLDAGSWFAPEFAGEPLPIFDEAGRLCIELALWANVEIKPAKGYEAETGRIAAAVSEKIWEGALPAPLLSSFSEIALASARVAAPALRRGWLTGELGSNWREIAARHECYSVHCDFRHLTQKQAAEVRASGLRLLCYTVNDPEVAQRLFAWGVDAVFTDRPDRVLPGAAAGR